MTTFAQMVLGNRSLAEEKLYRADNRPWVIGFSGDKDSTAVLALQPLKILRYLGCGNQSQD